MVPAPLLYPFRGEHRVDALLAGGGLHLLAVYVPVLPLVVVIGYLLVVFGETAGRDDAQRYDALPAFEGLRCVVRKGVGGTVVLAAFLLPAVVVLVVTVAGVSRLSLSPGDVTFGTSAGFVLGSTTSLLLAVTFLYILPAALANYLATGRLRGAVNVDVLGRAATHAAYFYNLTVGLVVSSLLLVVASATTALVVGFLIAFYAELVAVAFWARGVHRALPGVAVKC